MPDVLITPSSGNIRFSQNISDNAASVALSGNSLVLSSASGNISISSSSGLLINGVMVSASGHTHTSANITDFNSSVSGLLPTISNSGDNRVLTSNGSTVGINAESNLTFDGQNLSAPYLLATYASGDEGGEIQLAKPPSGTLSGGITIDVYQNRLRFFEQGGSARGFYLDISSAGAGASSNLAALYKTFCEFSSKDNYPPSSSFATIDTRNSVLVLDFDDSLVESAVFLGIVPDNIVLTSGITVRIAWMATSATSGNVRWRVEFERGNTDYDADSFGAATEANSTASATAGIPVYVDISSTTIDSLSPGDLFRIRISRVGTDATNDTMVGDAELIAISLRYN
jgi:hypothetical protein